MFDLNNQNTEIYSLNVKTENSRYYVSVNFRICIINSGSGKWEIGGKNYPVKKGDVILLNNRQKRTFTSVSKDECLNISVIGFEPQFVMNTQFSDLFFNDRINGFISGSSEILRLAEEIKLEEKQKQKNYKTIINCKIITILSLLKRNCSIAESEQYNINNDMYKALDYIEQNYTNDICVDSLSALLHISPNAFSKRFVKCMHTGFSNYIMQKRIHLALHLLDTTNKTVLEIALECGFNNTANFYKAFKKTAGGTPSGYRRSSRKIPL